MRYIETAQYNETITMALLEINDCLSALDDIILSIRDNADKLFYSIPNTATQINDYADSITDDTTSLSAIITNIQIAVPRDDIYNL